MLRRLELSTCFFFFIGIVTQIVDEWVPKESFSVVGPERKENLLSLSFSFSLFRVEYRGAAVMFASVSRGKVSERGRGRRHRRRPRPRRRQRRRRRRVLGVRPVSVGPTGAFLPSRLSRSHRWLGPPSFHLIPVGITCWGLIAIALEQILEHFCYILRFWVKLINNIIK